MKGRQKLPGNAPKLLSRYVKWPRGLACGQKTPSVRFLPLETQQAPGDHTTCCASVSLMERYFGCMQRDTETDFGRFALASNSLLRPCPVWQGVPRWLLAARGAPWVAGVPHRCSALFPPKQPCRLCGSPIESISTIDYAHIGKSLAVVLLPRVRATICMHI